MSSILASVTAGRGGRVITVGLLIVLLTACGLKDDLYLPDPPDPAGQTPGDKNDNEDEDDGKAA